MIFVLIESGSSKPFVVLGVGAGGSWGTIECQSHAGGGLQNLVKTLVTMEEDTEVEGCLLACREPRLMQPPEWIRRSRFWMMQIDDDMVGPQLVPKMQKTTVGRSRSEMQLRSERG